MSNVTGQVIQEPINAVTGRLNRGKNVQRLLATNSPTMVFATACQWLSIGRKIINGEKAISRILLGFDREDKQEERDQGNSKRGRCRYLKPVEIVRGAANRDDTLTISSEVISCFLTCFKAPLLYAIA